MQGPIYTVSKYIKQEIEKEYKTSFGTAKNTNSRGGIGIIDIAHN